MKNLKQGSRPGRGFYFELYNQQLQGDRKVSVHLAITVPTQLMI